MNPSGRRHSRRVPDLEAAPPSKQRTDPEPPKAGTILVTAAVFATAVLVYWPTRLHEFLNWDDPIYVVKNPWIRELSWQNISFIFSHSYFANYLPVHLLSYLLDHCIWGLSSFGFHLDSVLLHGINAALCLAVVRRITGSFPVAAISALLFAVHPSHVESVAWVSSRKDLLSMAFLLLSVDAYLRAGRGKAPRWVPYAASVAWFTLGLLSKVAIVVLPAFLLLLDRYPDPRAPRAAPLPWGRALASKVPFALVGAVLMAVNSRVQVKAQAAYAHHPLSYLMVKGHAVWNYIALTAGLRAGNPDYDLPRMGRGFLEIARNVGGLVVLPALACLFFRWRRRTEFLGVAWFFITLLPALLFPLVTYMADRYLYAPSLGFCWVVAAAAVEWSGIRHGRMAWVRFGAAVAVLLILVAGYTIQTWRYSGVWKNSESLWTYAITKSGDYRVFNNLADVRMSQKRWEEAERLLKIGAQYENVTSYQSLGVLYYGRQRFDEALSATDRALEILSKKGRDPAVSAELHFNRGAILWSQGDTARAVAEWEAALRENPAHAQAREWLAVARRPAR